MFFNLRSRDRFMNHAFGRTAGYLALTTWPTYIFATVLNATKPPGDRPVRVELLLMFAALGLMSGIAWIAHRTVLLSTEERLSLYKQGACDAWSVPPGPSADHLKSVSKTQRANGTNPL